MLRSGSGNVLINESVPWDGKKPLWETRRGSYKSKLSEVA
jgi:hypothetical protein